MMNCPLCGCSESNWMHGLVTDEARRCSSCSTVYDCSGGFTESHLHQPKDAYPLTYLIDDVLVLMPRGRLMVLNNEY